MARRDGASKDGVVAAEVSDVSESVQTKEGTREKWEVLRSEFLLIETKREGGEKKVRVRIGK